MSTVNGDPITDVDVPGFQSAVLILALTIYGVLVVSGVVFVTVFVVVLFRGRSTFKEVAVILTGYRVPPSDPLLHDSLPTDLL